MHATTTLTTKALSRAPNLLTLTVLAFVAIFSLAAAAYPGGTHFDHASLGHDFWLNTMCDVTRSVALDGRPNGLGCALASIAMIVLAAGLGVTFALLPRLFAARARMATSVRALGTVSALGAVAVVLLPSDRFGSLHGVAIVCAGIPGLAAALLALVALLRERRSARVVIALGCLALGVAALDFVLYLSELVSGGGSQVAVAVLERIATALLLAWMLAIARAARGASVASACESVRATRPTRRRSHRPACASRLARKSLHIVYEAPFTAFASNQATLQRDYTNPSDARLRADPCPNGRIRGP